jgi:hypothetical protein
LCIATWSLRLATLFRNENRVRALLRHRYDEFATLLDRLAGTVEIGVKLYVEERLPVRAAAPNSSGRAYLQQLSQRQRQREARSRHAPTRLSGAAGTNILNAAYLVHAARVADFIELTGRLATEEPALRVEVTGPWAPYSFTDTERGDW